MLLYLRVRCELLLMALRVSFVIDLGGAHSHLLSPCPGECDVRFAVQSTFHKPRKRQSRMARAQRPGRGN